VVTGTLWSGVVARGDRVVVLPSGLEARVRSVEVHDRQVEEAGAGQRVALNLAGVGRDEVARGDVVTAAGSALAPTWLVDARLSLEPGVRIERGTRVHVHHGTREAPARVVPIEGSDLVQLRLESQLVPAAGDRLVLRQVAPPDTIGGGEVVDPRPRKHSRLDPEPPANTTPGDLWCEEHQKSPAEELDGRALELAALPDSGGLEPRADGELVAAAGIEDARGAWAALERAGRAVRVAKNLHYAPEPLAELERRITAICERDGSATIAAVRDELGTSRRYAQALLEHLDAKRVTIRRGDEHVLRRTG
jgi:selenocysteine-specific elongation factor